MPFIELFLAISFETPHTTTASFFVSWFHSVLAVSFMNSIPEPGFPNPSTSNLSFSRCFTSAAHPLAWLSPMITTLCFFFSSVFFYSSSYHSSRVWDLSPLTCLYSYWGIFTLGVIVQKVSMIGYYWEWVFHVLFFTVVFLALHRQYFRQGHLCFKLFFKYEL